MAEELKSAEVENALTTIFTKIDTLESNMIDLVAKNADTRSVADRALSIAREAKSSIKEIRTVPTNANDVAIVVFRKLVGLATLGIITFGVVKVLTYAPKEDKEK